MDGRQQELVLVLPSEPVWVHGDEARLAQVVSNLLNNASTYSPAKARIELELVLEQFGVRLSVTDEGIGMSEETMAAAFERFVQGQRSQELGPGGLGLGLTVARALVEIHGGRIAAESPGEGLGSRFTIWLPNFEVPAASATALTAPPSEPPPTSGHVRVLVVDDNADAADAVSELLRLSGHEVHTAYGAEEALAVAPAFAPQVAVLDIGLPVIDGRQLAGMLRQRLPVAPKFIALSGFGQDRDREISLQAGFAAHLVKPPNIDALLSLLVP